MKRIFLSLIFLTVVFTSLSAPTSIDSLKRRIDFLEKTSHEPSKLNEGSSFNEKSLPYITTTITAIIVCLLTIFSKNFIETKILKSKLNTEHKFDQRKKIKEAVAKYKVHLITACEDYNHRMWNFLKPQPQEENWLNVQGNYLYPNYYFHSFIYRHLVIFAWVKKIQKEMIFLDTTIASKEDLEFVKFLNIFSRIFCDLTFIEGANADGTKAKDHFFRNVFDLFADTIITSDGVKSFSTYMDELKIKEEDNKSITHISEKLRLLYMFYDGVSTSETRKRWDRLHLFHLTVIMFLNNYGYDFQVTNKEKLVTILTLTKKSDYLTAYFNLLNEYHMMENKKIKELKKIIDSAKNNKA